MEDILDEIPDKIISQKFAWLSLLCSAFLLIIFGNFTYAFSGTIKASETLEEPSKLFSRLSQIITLASMTFIIVSYVKKRAI